ncbi:unnamed protein product [Ambrosiozyma monospora]|uniref:NADH dehydrogenase [ubiquinone] iron-sulfur protein 4, mitochondrial n=1 Tax=Ambrosiozyma monospora TaxID=43982 RepID=A0A9W6YT82_AMBMO|nr:unnamed protein product [Ambrosiozyma monospora]
MLPSQFLRAGLRQANRRAIHTTAFRLNNASSTGTQLAKIIESSTHHKELVSGAPAELSEANNRLVRIYKEAKYATQSASGNSKYWKLEWDVLSKGNRWENDMMGYQKDISLRNTLLTLSMLGVL